MYFDLVFMINLPRFILAILAIRSQLWMGTYAKVRMITMFIESILAFVGIIGYVIFQTWVSGSWGKSQYIWSLVGLTVVIAVFLLDFHYCKVIQYKWRKIERQL